MMSFMKKRKINWSLRSRIKRTKRDKASVFFEPTIRLRWKNGLKAQILTPELRIKQRQNKIKRA